MKTANEIMSALGINAKNISINFADGKWQASYKTDTDIHTESANTIDEAMSAMYKWYSIEKSPKRIAEKLRDIIIGIKKQNELPYPKDDMIASLCNKALALFDTDAEGKVVWSDCFNEEENEFVATTSEQGTISCTKKKPQQEIKKKQNIKKPATPKRTESDDGLPLYFEVKTPSFMFVKCYGYDAEGNRVYINIDMQNYSNTSITPCASLNKSDFPDDMITTIAEDEFNSRYDEAANLIMNAKNYQPIDYSNVEIIKED